MKTVILLSLLLFAFAGCNRTHNNKGNSGGQLPMLITNWTEIADGDALTQFDYGNIVVEGLNINTDELLAIIGDDQPIPCSVVAQMLESIGHPYPGKFTESEMLTLEQAQDIMRRLHPTGMTIYLTDENRHQYISYALWVELFVQLIKQQDDNHGIEATDIIPLGTKDGQTLTNHGTFGGKNINLGAFFDQEIRVLRRNMEIIAVLGITNRTPTLKNALIMHSDAFGITVFIGGATRNYVYMADVIPLEAETIVANVQIRGQEIIAITPAETVITGTIERIRPHAIELHEWGAIPLCPFFAVYGLPAIAKTTQDLLVGANMADFHMIDGRIAAAVITHDITPKNIRVAISTSGFTGLIHESLTISSTGAFTVRGGGRTEHFAAERHFTVSEVENADLWGGIRLYITPDDPENHRLKIVELRRNWANAHNPQYRGTFEISHYNCGGFLIVNELCIEEYLFAVIPSEMPTSHGLEAAKVQAITARSFAIHQLYQNAFREFGAHVCDSVISQVYNNTPETEISVAAVNATRGQVLAVGGRPVIANYFSTSGGTTANFGEVWAQSGQFPGYMPVHLRAMPQFYMQDYNPGDLSRERYAAAFFRSHDIPAFERDFPWFRWQVRLTAAELSDSINANIAARQAANPAMAQALEINGEPTSTAVQTIGLLTNLEVVRRGQGGNIMEMIFSGTEAVVLVRTEFNIRTLLSPGATPVTRQDGSQVANLWLLPSAFFTMEKETDACGRITAVTFFGGGNGHGVGMSQNGVRALVDMGLTYREILHHFYPGADVVLR